MKITNKASFTVNDLILYSKKIVFKNTYKYSFIGIALFLAGISLYFAANVLESNIKYVAILFTLFGFVFIIMPFLAIKLSSYTIKKQNKLFNEGINYNYEFLDDVFLVTSQSNENIIQSRLQYKKLYKIDIIGEDVYLYTSPSSVYIVMKSGFPSAFECEEFIEFISKVELEK